MLDVHKALLDAQRIRYERVHGRIETSGELLGRVLHHPDFEWIRALSGLLAELDAWIDDAEAGSGQAFTEIVERLKALVQPQGGDPGFYPRYWQMVQEEPAVTVAHVKLTRLLSGP